MIKGICGVNKTNEIGEIWYNYVTARTMHGKNDLILDFQRKLKLENF